MTDDIQIVPYDPARKTEVAELLNVCLGKKATGCRDEDYWTWKHEQNPFGQSVMLLAECDGRLVGVRALMRWRLMCDGRAVEAVKPVDTVTHPDYQRRGIFSRLTTRACDDAREAGISLIFNTPNQNSKPGYLKLGWQQVAELPLYAKWLRPASAVWNALRSKAGATCQSAPEDFFREAPPSACDVIHGDSQWALPAQTQDAADRLQTQRDSQFLQWRYGQHPHLRYYTETIGPRAKPDGLLFYRTNLRGGLREIMVNDVIVRNDDSDIRLDLIRQLCSRVDAHYIVAHAADQVPLLKSLRQLGFRRVPGRRIALVARSLVDGIRPDPFRASSWSLCLGDLEGL